MCQAAIEITRQDHSVTAWFCPAYILLREVTLLFVDFRLCVFQSYWP